MAHQPRRTRSMITRSEIIATLAVLLVVAWLALVAVGMGL